MTLEAESFSSLRQDIYNQILKYFFETTSETPIHVPQDSIDYPTAMLSSALVTRPRGVRMNLCVFCSLRAPGVLGASPLRIPGTTRFRSGGSQYKKARINRGKTASRVGIAAWVGACRADLYRTLEILHTMVPPSKDCSKLELRYKRGGGSPSRKKRPTSCLRKITERYTHLRNRC